MGLEVKLKGTNKGMRNDIVHFAWVTLLSSCVTAVTGQTYPLAPPSELQIGGSGGSEGVRTELVLPVDSTQWTVLEKIPVSDSRVVRAFFGSAVDGATNSWDYSGAWNEFPHRTVGARYDFNRNDGLHLKLADPAGFDMIVLRGGAKALLYANTGYSLTQPTNDAPIFAFAGGSPDQTALLPSRIAGGQFAFFKATNGVISDVAFYRISALGSLLAAVSYRVGAPVVLPNPATPWQADSLYRAMTNRYGPNDRSSYSLSDTHPVGTPLVLSANQAVHFITQPFLQRTGLVSVAMDFTISGAALPAHGVLAVQDPLDPQLDICWVDFTLNSNGRGRLCLDIPDQVLLPNTRVWVSFRLDSSATISASDGGAPQVQLQLVDAATAFPQAINWRKFLMKNYFSILSEPGPWYGFSQSQSADNYLATLENRMASRLAELFYAIDNCYALAPADDLVRQYREWVYLTHLPSLSTVADPPRPPSGVPQWAWYPRLAWLQHRSVVQWWLDNRLVPTGELGGLVSDDSDWYQQTLDLPYFETNGITPLLKNSARRLCDTARTNRYLTGGVNTTTQDSLHAYEEGVNHLALMARWFYGDPVYLEYCMESARNVQRLTITTDGGAWFRNKDLIGYSATNANVSVDGYATPLLWHTTLQVADYNHNPLALSNVTAWSDTWVRFQTPGQYATEINVNSTGVTAYSPSRSLNGYGQAAVFTWLSSLLNGEEKYMQPWMNDYAILNRTYPATYYVDFVYNLGLLDGHPDWANWWAKLNPSLAIYANFNQNVLINQLLLPTTVYSYRITTLVDAGRWPDMYTTAEQFSDRIYPNLLEWPSRSMLGGFSRRNEFSPKAAVSWEGFGTNYGAIVTSHRRDRLSVCAYNFSTSPVSGAMRLWEIEHGRYEVKVGPDANQDWVMESVSGLSTNELAKGDVVGMTLPPGQVTMVNLRQVAKLDPIFNRADLALSRSEVTISNNFVSGMVHNIGSQAVRDVVVTLLDTDSTVIAKVAVGSLEAPVDLVPRRAPFTIPFQGSPRAMRVVLDAEDLIPEIFEGNNQVMLTLPSGR